MPSTAKSSRKLCVCPVHTRRWASDVCRSQFYCTRKILHLFIQQIYVVGHCSGAGDLVINKWPMAYNLMERTHKLFCLKILYNQRYLCTDHMTTVCHSLNLSDMTWICKNLVLKHLDSQEERTLALSDKSQKEF